jgi:integrase
MAKSTKSRPKRKSQKPYPDFPLTAHPSGRWCKKHRGKQYYFGPIDNWQNAYERFQREWPYIIDGRVPPAADTGDACSVRGLCNEFLNSKRLKLDAGELSERSFRDYYKTCASLVENFGRDRRVDDLRPADFERYRSRLAINLGTVSLKNEINRCRVVFKYAHDQRLVDQPVNYGQSFNRPSAKMIRRARNAAGPKDFTANEVRRILNACEGGAIEVDDIGGVQSIQPKRDPALMAMVLLGVNCGFGNTDVASLPQSVVNLDSCWIEFPRPKTEIRRRIPLWPKTAYALRVAIASRPAPKDPGDVELCFLTAHGNRWVRIQERRIAKDEFETGNTKTESRVVPIDALSQKFARLLKKLGVGEGRGFYSLRHTFETQGGESTDQVAVNAIMGHVENSMAGVYRERISDERLQAVVETVRKWLWPDEESPDDQDAEESA